MSIVSMPLPRPAAAPPECNHRWKVLGIGVAANATFSAVFAGIPTTAVFMRSDYHLGNTQLGLALSLLGLGVAISELPWGLLTDRQGDRRVLLTGLGTMAAALLCMALFAVPTPSHAPSLLLLATGLFVIGLLGGSVNGSSGRAVMAWFREGERGFAMSIRQTAVPLGGGLGALALPSLASHFGFSTVYAALALLCFVTMIYTWLWLRQPPTVESRPDLQQLADPAQESAPGPLRNIRIWRIALAIAALCTPQVAVLTFTAVFLHDFGHASVATISATLLAVQFGAAATRVWSGRWTDRNNNRHAYMRACSWLSAVVFAMLTACVMLKANYSHWHEHAVTLAMIALLTLGGICVSAWHGVAFTELATLAGASRAGTALGLGNTSVFVAFVLAPLAIPALLTLGAWPAVWMAASLCALIAIPLLPRPVQLTPR